MHADTVRCGEFFKAGSFDVVVTDAPYGVQHGSRIGGRRAVARATRPRSGKPRRSGHGCSAPGERSGSPGTPTSPAGQRLVELLAGAGLEVVDDTAYLALRHRVDQAIVRDIVVARRPG